MDLALPLRWSGQRRWEEVWFVEGVTPEGDALWLRYTLTLGADPRIALWAAWFPASGAPQVGYVEKRTLPGARPPGENVHLWAPLEAQLSTSRASGVAGPIAWDLHLHGGGGWPNTLIPPAIGALGRSYRAAFPDLTAHGHVTVHGVHRPLRLTGVLGHLWGRRSSVQAWGWAHANRFDQAPGMVLEVVVANLRLPGGRAPLVGSAILHGQGRTLYFSSIRSIFRSEATLRPDSFRLDSRARGWRLQVDVQLPPDARRVVARYDGPAGQVSWCDNGPHARVEARLERRGLPPLFLQTDRGVAEVGSCHPLSRPPVLGRVGSDGSQVSLERSPP